MRTFTGVGRVTVAVTLLEYTLALIITMRYDESEAYLMERMWKPGLHEAFTSCWKSIGSADLVWELKVLGDTAEEIRRERHDVVHSMLLSEFRGDYELIGHRVHNPRSDVTKPLPRPEDLTELARRARAKAARALMVAEKVAKYAELEKT